MIATKRLILLSVLAGACSEGSNAKSEGASTQTAAEVADAADQAAASDQKTTSPEGKTLFTYPPSGAGPHTGFDLGAIREKLQGTWMIGGSAFAGIPRIWHISGDEVIAVDSSGKRSEHTLELYAPCYGRLGDVGGSSATFVSFVFDGDTLYSGLGNAGYAEGDRTVGCVSSGVYVLEGDTCTMWKKKPFPRKGEQVFESSPGECGYEGEVFYADDTNAKRSIYGKQTLAVREGNALMTKQMQGNKAEKVESLEVAIAKQKVLLDAKDALTRPPEELAFTSWGLTSKKLTAEPNQKLWSVAVDREGNWNIGNYRFKSEADGVVWLRGMTDRFSPSAFVKTVNTADFKRGQPIVYRTGRMLWGNVLSVKGEDVTMTYLSGSRVKEKTAKAEMFLSVGSGEFTLGSPVMWQAEGQWDEGLVVFDAGEKVYILDEATSLVTPMPRSDLKLIGGAKAYKKGAKVLVKQPSGIAPLRWLPGKVTKVLGGGAAYEVKTDTGSNYTQSWAKVTAP